MKKATLILAVLTLVAAASSSAGMIPQAQTWIEGPVRYLVTPAEQTELRQVSSQADFERFVELFWAKRDPDLKTRVNEFKMDFEARVAAADKQFAEQGVRGSMTDRGRVLVLMGAPAKSYKLSIQNFLDQLVGEKGRDFSTDARSANQAMHGAQYDHYKGMVNVWIYNLDQIAPSIGVPKRVDSVMFAFFDYDGKNHWVLERRFQPSRWAVKAVEASAEALLLHPDMVEVPTYPLLPGGQVATDAQLAWLGQTTLWPEGSVAEVYPGVMTEKIIPYWVFLRLPKGTQADLAVGRLTSKGGQVLGTFQKPVQMLDTQRGAVWELMLPPVESEGTLELALAASGSPVAVHSVEIAPVKAKADGPFFTRIFAGAEIQQLENFEAGAPFVFGGYHLILRPHGHYAKGENLDYMCLIAHPAVGEDGQPKAKMRIAIYQGKTRLKGTPYREAQLSPVEPNVYMFGSQLPLNIFRKGGEFTLKVWLKDMISETEVESDLPIVLPES